jgi:2-polyprenyl-6-methoxyphenol hydroxylase-like FAD-dependent oxidoreductase
LAAAIALRRVGFVPVVCESASELREIGSGLTLWPNALRALTHLGVADPLRAISRPSRGIAMRTSTGEVLFTTAQDGSCASLKTGGVAVHRTELLDLLFRALGNGVVRLGARCVDVRQDDRSVAAVLSDGSIVSGDVLVGADGLRSTVRERLHGPAKLRYAGHTVWRGIAEYSLTDDAGVTTLGPGAEFGLFPMTRNRVYWFASATAKPGGWGAPRDEMRTLLDRFCGWHEPIAAVLTATDPAEVIRTDVYDIPPRRRWSIGRATLLGDAAHPATPSLGQGACQAFEDAVVLAKVLGETENVCSVLRVYEALRAPRTSRIVAQSWRMSRIGRWESRLACSLRARLIKSIPQRLRARELRALFEWDA